MSIAFLILTMGTPNSSIDYLIKHNYNIYIHPKYEIDEKYKKYIIPKIAETKWCDVVEAEINLLEEALKNSKNKYFMIVSGDAYLLYNSKQIDDFDPIYSCFSYSTKFEINNKKYYKAATWWILNRKDAEIICNTKKIYIEEFKNFRECKEEYYFLSVLNNEEKNYIYINHKYTYTKWLFKLGMSHPITYNKLTNEDINDINSKDYIFMRKVLPTFKFEPIKDFQKNLYILCIGTETKQDTIDYFINNNLDFIIVTFISISEINKELLDNCISIYGSISYKDYYNFILDICIFNNYYLQQWSNNIIFISESFNINSLNFNNLNNNLNNNKNNKKMVSIQANNNNFKVYDYYIRNKKLFNYFKDENNNICYYISIKNLKEFSFNNFKIDFDFPL